MAFDMREETLRHRETWKGFVLFLKLATLGAVVVLAILALALL